MTMQFIKIGQKYIALAHIRAVEVSPMGTRVLIHLDADEGSILGLQGEEAKAFLEFLALRTLDITPEPQE